MRSKEPEVKKKLQNYLYGKGYEFNRSHKTRRIKEFVVKTRFNRQIKFDIMAFKRKAKQDEILFIECKGSKIRQIGQGYGQILLYRLLFTKCYKKNLMKKYEKLGLVPTKQKNVTFCFAFHEDAIKKYKKILNELYGFYKSLKIRTYIIKPRGNPVVKKEKSY